MRAILLLLLGSGILLAQPTETLIEKLELECLQASQSGHFAEAATKREAARSLLDKIPVNSPDFGQGVQEVARLYESFAMTARAREIVEAALARTSQLPASYPTRTLLLSYLAKSWQKDGNLLKAAAYLEKFVSALESAPVDSHSTDDVASQLIGAYRQLATLYRETGRQEEFTAIPMRIKQVPGIDSDSIATVYEERGQVAEAADIYKQQVTQAASDPEDSARAWNNLAQFYQRTNQYTDSAAAYSQSIASLKSSGAPTATIQMVRQNLAEMLQEAGRTEEADQQYQELLSYGQNGQDPYYSERLTRYAYHLNNTNRSKEALRLLSDFLESHTGLDVEQENNLLTAAVSASQASGDSERAAAYQRKIEMQAEIPPPIDDPMADVKTLLVSASNAIREGNSDLAFSLALRAIGALPTTAGPSESGNEISTIALDLILHREQRKGEQLYGQWFATMQARAGDNLDELLDVAQNHVRFLMNWTERASEVPEAIEQYRELLVKARGPNSGHLLEALNMTIDFARSHGSTAQALRAAQEALALAESTSGNTSESYLHALEVMADVHAEAGDIERVVVLRRQSLAVADLVYPAADVRRAEARVRLALALARAEQFDEAEQLVREAIQIGSEVNPSESAKFEQSLEEVQKIKSAKKQ